MLKLEIISFFKYCRFKCKSVFLRFIEIIRKDMQLAFFSLRILIYKFVCILKFLSMFSLIPGVYFAYKSVTLFGKLKFDIVFTDEFRICIYSVLPYFVLTFISAILKYDK